MGDCISLRINKIISDLFEGNKSEFARTVGVSESAVRSYLANTIPKADVLEKIASKTAISCEWLVLGRGEMLKRPESGETLSRSLNELASISDEVRRLRLRVADLEKIIETQAKLISMLERK